MSYDGEVLDDQARLDRSFAAVICDWDSTGLADRPPSAKRARRAVDELTQLGVEIILVSGSAAGSIDARLLARPAGPGRLHLCVNRGAEVFRVEADGPRLLRRRRAIRSTDKSDSMDWALDYLKDRGIGPGLLLVVGGAFGSLGTIPGDDARLLVPRTRRATVVSVGAEPAGAPDGVIHRPGGPAMVLAMLRELAARLRCCVPDIDDDPAWTLHLPVSADREGADQALTTLADGRFGSRGLREEDQSPHPAVLIAGVYVGQAAGQRLMEGPSWVGLRGITGPAHSDERVLDLRTGVLARRRHDATGEFRSLRAIAVNHPGMMALRAQADTRLSGAPLHLPAGTAGHRGRADGRAWVRVLAEPAGGVSAAATQWSRRNDGRVFLERRVAVAADPRRAPSAGDAIERLEGSAHVPLTALLAEQRAAWATRWADGDVLIPDDPQLQLAARFALFHLQSSVAGRGEAAVGARGLAGAGYLGHVFWDADVFVLPVLTAIRPAGARSMLEYRLRRLDAARVFAAASGRRGARFPWESARDGEDVTPRVGLADGREVPIRTGEAEEHIVADVAWAAWHYAMWSGDERFLTGDGFPLLIESARYWTSRVRVDTDGRAHIDAVIGPDEYHGPVNDNTYTNVMARWNLRRAADLARGHAVGIEAGEAETWLTIADTLVDGYDPRTGIYEQFAGYHRLEPLLPTALARVPMAADLLLGAQRLATTQIIKQADVLMAHHLVPAEMRAGSLAANLDFYGARTAHGSSLSPAVHAALLARSGAPDEALYWLRLAARLDLDDLTGATASGLHMATLGGVWQALAWGFAGVHADQGALRIDPHLPDAWSSLTLRLRFRGRKVTLTVGHDEVRVDSDAPIQVALGDRAAVSTAHIVLRADGEYPASLSRPLS